MVDDSSDSRKQKAELVLRTLTQPDALVLRSTVNANFDSASKSQKQIAHEVGVVSAALTHYRNGDRVIPIDIIQNLAISLGWAAEIEQYVVEAWLYDQEVKSLARYVENMFANDDYRQIDFVIAKVYELYLKLDSARKRARAFPPPVEVE